MTRFLLPALTVVALAALGGCATGPRLARPDAMRDVPAAFLVGSPTGGPLTAPTPDLACRNPMVDPRDGARLVLDRSADGQGDYRVPEGRYGVPAGGWLRLDCTTGRALGVVGRRAGGAPPAPILQPPAGVVWAGSA